jgi:hypothetical protein
MSLVETPKKKVSKRERTSVKEHANDYWLLQNGILRNPDRTRTRPRRKSGLEKNPDPDSKKIRTRV